MHDTARVCVTVSSDISVTPMQDIFAGFTWAVAPDYEWQDWLDSEGQPLEVPRTGAASLASDDALERAWKKWGQTGIGPILAKKIQGAADERHYQPLKTPVFQEFADLEFADREAIRAFARKYGILGLPQLRQGPVVVTSSGQRVRHDAYGESLLGWAVEVARMREGLALVSNHDSFEKKRRLKGLMDHHLQDVRGHISFDQSGKPKITIEPFTLISAMWLQLASTLTGAKRFEACKFCGRLFEISTDRTTGSRRHRVFCGDPCKTNDYRRRRRTALQLAKEGISLAQIASRLETSQNTVRSWVVSGAKQNKGKK